MDRRKRLKWAVEGALVLGRKLPKESSSDMKGAHHQTISGWMDIARRRIKMKAARAEAPGGGGAKSTSSEGKSKMPRVIRRKIPMYRP